MKMDAFFTFLTSLDFKTWIAAIGGVVTACTAVTALTPTKVDNLIVNALLAVLNVLAGNVGQNKNADAQ
jgi:hypothetical protein